MVDAHGWSSGGVCTVRWSPARRWNAGFARLRVGGWCGIWRCENVKMRKCADADADAGAGGVHELEQEQEQDLDWELEEEWEGRAGLASYAASVATEGGCYGRRSP